MWSDDIGCALSGIMSASVGAVIHKIAPAPWIRWMSLAVFI